MSNINSLFTHNQKNDFKPQSDEFLGEDGEIYCRKCKTPRTIHLNELWVRCVCRCQAETYDKEQKQKKEQEHIDKINQLQNNAFLGKRYRTVSFSNTQCDSVGFQKAFDSCLNYAQNYKQALVSGNGIYLYGETGTGKTHLTACIGNYLLNHGIPIIFTNFIDISNHIFNNDNEFITQLLNMDFLVIDDIGAERLKLKDNDSFMQEKVYYIINYRYNNQKPTIFSSNYSIGELIEKRGLEKRTADRIAEMSVFRINLNGVPNYRMKLWEKQNANKNTNS